MTAAELGRRAEAMLNALGAISDDPARLTRLFLSPAHARAIALVREWIVAAGLEVRTDALATVHGLLPAATKGPSDHKRLVVGSHIDTVVDAGRHDGALGVVAGIIAAQEIAVRGVALPFALEILAFGDEEGVRFPHTLTSSRAIAGAFDPAALEATDRDGVSFRAALAALGGDPDAMPSEAYRRDDVIGYIEVHIEQGPVLEREGEPLAVVSAIAGQGRYRVRVAGEAGHAGTVPMDYRHDALAAAAEMVLAVEGVTTGWSPLVATVGEMLVSPGAANVIPGEVAFSIDIRSSDDGIRGAATAALNGALSDIGERRGVRLTIETVHQQLVTPCAPRMKHAIASAITDLTGRAPCELMSGAGHDGQAMAHLTDIGMVFVRCRNGISHSPREYASPEDVGLGIEALIGTIRRLAGS